MGRKREKPYPSRHVSSSLAKRLRPIPTPEPPTTTTDQPSRPASAVLVVTGLSRSSSVLDLKSRFEMYGCISRLRIDRAGIGYITFRSRDSAEAAMAAAGDPSVGITIDSKRVQLFWANDPIPQWRDGIGISSDNDHRHQPASKLLRPEIPLSRHGRGNKLGTSSISPTKDLEMPFKGREIIAYDDLL